MIHKQFGEVPAAGPLEAVDEDLLAAVRGGFETVGGLLERQRVRAAIAEAMRLVGEANAYVSKTEPFRSRPTTSASGSPRSSTSSPRCVTDLNTLMSPFLPHSANAIHAVLGGDGRPRPHAAARGRSTTSTADLLPGHHRRLLRDAAVGVAPGGRRDPGRQAEAGLPQARPSRSRRARAVSPHRSPSRRDERPPAPDPCRSRSSTTTSTSTSPGTARTRRRLDGRCRGGRRGRGRPRRPGRLRPAGVRFTGEASERMPALLGASPCTPTRCRARGRRGARRRAGRGRGVGRASARPGRGGDRTRLLPDRAGGGPPQQNAFRWHIDLAKRTRQGPADPRPRRPRRRAADPRRGGCPDAHGAALLLRRSSGWRECVERGYLLSFAGTVTFKSAPACATRSP